MLPKHSKVFFFPQKTSKREFLDFKEHLKLYVGGNSCGHEKKIDVTLMIKNGTEVVSQPNQLASNLYFFDVLESKENDVLDKSTFVMSTSTIVHADPAMTSVLRKMDAYKDRKKCMIELEGFTVNDDILVYLGDLNVGGTVQTYIMEIVYYPTSYAEDFLNDFLNLCVEDVAKHLQLNYEYSITEFTMAKVNWSEWNLRENQGSPSHSALQYLMLLRKSSVI